MSRPKGSKNKPKEDTSGLNLEVQKQQNLTSSNLVSSSIVKRGRGRPKKNKSVKEIQDEAIERANRIQKELQEVKEPIIIKRGRGRPKGSTKKSQYPDILEIKKDNPLLVNLFGNIKDIKREIRRLRKVKLQCRAGSKERIELHRKIKDLKSQLINLKTKKIEPISEEESKYEKRFYSGYLRPATIERFKKEFGILFIQKSSI